jgi:glycosyltransferase involved in cell wall biosynthesis
MLNAVRTYLIICAVVCNGVSAHDFHKFVFITASYNNSHRYKENIDSMLKQEYPAAAFRLIYIDDCSTDDTGHLVENYLKHNHKIKATLLKNKRRRGQLANIYDATHTCQDNEIIVIVDGDDKLAHKDVLNYLNSFYKDPQVWLTYGQFLYDCKGNICHGKRGPAQPFPEHIIRKGNFRAHPGFVLSHLRTYYAWLFKQIALRDLLYESYFYSYATDVAAMYPMTEMAGNKFKYLNKVLYSYTCSKTKNIKQPRLLSRIKHKKPYRPLVRPVYTVSPKVFCLANLESSRQAVQFNAKVGVFLAMRPVVYTTNNMVKKIVSTMNPGIPIFMDKGKLYRFIVSQRREAYILIARDFLFEHSDLRNATQYLHRSVADSMIVGKEKVFVKNKEIHPRIHVIDNKTTLRLIAENSVIVRRPVFWQFYNELLGVHSWQKNAHQNQEAMKHLLSLFYRHERT